MERSDMLKRSCHDIDHVSHLFMCRTGSVEMRWTLEQWTAKMGFTPNCLSPTMSNVLSDIALGVWRAF